MLSADNRPLTAFPHFPVLLQFSGDPKGSASQLQISDFGLRIEEKNQRRDRQEATTPAVGIPVDRTRKHPTSAACHWQLACQCRPTTQQPLADEPPVVPWRDFIPDPVERFVLPSVPEDFLELE
ncbi:MAG: hypothetical protein IIA66_12855 [Planctomycetes bacterium]|nr:hypothetical protein [Planctomycetota bacterium]